MHGWILGVAAALLVGAARGEDTDTQGCPRADAAVLERFISAECAACWTDSAIVRPAAGEWLLDWIVPSKRGDDAPLSPAAPLEARARAQRALAALPADDRTSVRRTDARERSSPQLRVSVGPAWNGYLGVQVDASGRIGDGASVWVALVETVSAGTDGSAVPRELVRTLSGPMQPVELRRGQPWQLLQAMRWPETAKASRLRVRAWVEDAGGRIVVMAGERCEAR